MSRQRASKTRHIYAHRSVVLWRKLRRCPHNPEGPRQTGSAWATALRGGRTAFRVQSPNKEGRTTARRRRKSVQTAAQARLRSRRELAVLPLLPHAGAVAFAASASA